MSSDSNNNDDDYDGMGIAYTTNEEYSNRNDIRSMSTNPVEYLEFVAEQEQFSPRNLSIHQDSLQLKQPPPPHEQFIHLKQAPINVNYIIRDDNSQQNLTNISNNNNNNNNNMYNPYFPPTEQQVQQFYNSKRISNQLSPLDEVVHNNPHPEPYRVEINNNNNNQQNPSQGYQHQQLHQLQQQLQQFQQPPKPIPNHNDNVGNNNETLQSPIDHSTVTPSPLALPGLYLTRNRSRVSTPRIENLPRIPSAYTAQVQQSDSPLRTEFRNNEIGDRSSGPSKRDTFKNMLGEILNQDRLSNISERIPNETDETLVKFDFRNANGDPDDPLLNNKNIPIEDEEQQLPTGLLNGNVNNNNNNNNNNNTLNISHQDSNDSSIVSPISPISPMSQVTPILKKSITDDKDHDVIIIGDQEIKLLKPKQGAIFMLIAVFVLAAIVFIAWKLGDWGVGDAKNIYNYSANNGVVLIYPSGTKKLPPIPSNSSRKRRTY